MKILKSKILWLTLYTIVITGVFLYLLFPSPLALQKVEDAASASGIALRAEALKPSLPLGFKFRNVNVRSPLFPEGVFFQGDVLDFQLNLLSLFRKYKSIDFSGKAYGGLFDGNAGFASLTKPVMPAEGRVSFKKIDLSKVRWQGLTAVKGLTGTVNGLLVLNAGQVNRPGPSGKLSVYMLRGAYPLPEPFLGVSRIEYDRGEIQAQLKDMAIQVDKFEFFGPQINCFLAGDIQLAGRMEDSRLNLKGTLEIPGKAKVKMNVTVGGTLASPYFRYM